MKNKIDILTIAYNLNYEAHNNFIDSLLKTGFSGNVYIASAASDKPVIDEILNKYANKNIHYVVDDNKIDYNITTKKFFEYDKFIDTIKSDYIFVCDFKDVFFQENIENFDYEEIVDIYATLEDQTFVQDENYTSQWVKWTEELLNISIYDQIKNDIIICSGTTLGKANAIKLYLKEMLRILQLTTEYLRWRVYDQGVHNYLLRLNPLNLNIKFVDNNNDLVCTMGDQKKSIHKDKKRIFCGSKIVNEQNNPYYVLHQYNRMCESDINKLLQK
jgi:hypothetical protein